jgi:quinol monooxygenase YgiN
VLLVSLICGSAVAVNAGVILASGPRIFGAVALLHAGGFALGYGVPRAAGVDERSARTISIETGMQNSALAVVLARALGRPDAAVVGAVSATVHSVLGSLLAGFWRGRPLRRAARYCLSVCLKVRAERRREFLACIGANRRGTLSSEPLALEYLFGEDEEEPNTFHFFEAYEGREGFEAHTRTPHFKDWEAFAATDPLTEAPQVRFYTEEVGEGEAAN